MRKSSVFILFTATAASVFTLLLTGYPLLTGRYYRQIQAEQAALVRALGLTDLCLFTEAPYTRHLSLADNFSAFSDSPMVYEHFPSGSLTIPPQLVQSQTPAGQTDPVPESARQQAERNTAADGGRRHDAL